MTQFLENLRTDGRTDGRTEELMDGPYCIGPFRPRPGVQKLEKHSWRSIKSNTPP